MITLRERANAGLHDFVFKYIQNQVRPSVSTTLLDIGCGSGAWLNRFRQLGMRNMLGVDLDTGQFALSGVHTKAMNLDDYDGSVLGQYNLITALELIEHLENPGLLFKLVQNNLAPGGDLIISTPNIHALPARIRYVFKGRLNHFDDKSDATHIYPVYLENVERVLPRHDLKIQNTVSFPEKGYGTYRSFTRHLSGIASVFLKDHLPGDNIILHIRRKD